MGHHTRLKENKHLFRYRFLFRRVRARANLRALMTQKSCAVGMRNAILRNHLKMLQSWTKVLGQIYIWALFHTRQTNSSTLVQPLPLPPFYNVGHVYKLFLQSFNIVLGGGGRKQRILKRIRVLFLKFRLKNTGNNAITQVSQGILSTIVGSC